MREPLSEQGWIKSEQSALPDEPYYHVGYSYALASPDLMREAEPEAKRVVELLPLSKDAVDAPDSLLTLAHFKSALVAAFNHSELIPEIIESGIVPLWFDAR